MFGFQRIGDLIWAAADARAKGFMLGGTAGRTTLNGEGLQHQDGHSLLFSMAYPTVRSYDPAYSYEIAIIVMDGMRRMYELGEDAIYYITLENENYRMPAMPKGVEEGVLRGMYKLQSVDAGAKRPKVQLLGSGAILREALRAQTLLAEKFQVSSDVWSVTSYRELRREAQAAERWNLLHPTSKPRRSYLEEVVGDEPGPWVASSDYVRAVSEQISPWIPGGLYALGTDGLGRSDLRPRLRRHFEVDAENIVLASLRQLARQQKFDLAAVGKAVKQLGIDPEKIDPVTA